MGWFTVASIPACKRRLSNACRLIRQAAACPGAADEATLKLGCGMRCESAQATAVPRIRSVLPFQRELEIPSELLVKVVVDAVHCR